MNISYNWLKELIEIDLSAEETAAALTRVGLAVEGIHSHGEDFVLDIDLTSNRPDCLSHLGVARELSAITGKGVKIAPVSPEIPMPPVLAYDIVRIEAPDLCHRFTARIIRGVKVGPSPRWLVDRLEAIGERSINNVADITNYVMHELGQPMHAFDLDRLQENRIVVRKAAEGETIVTLDEVERKLDPSMVVVCDATKPAAIGGIMGGLDSSITDSTVNVLLEVAYFKAQSVRATSRSLGLATEASYRFERGVDIETLIRASNRATDLICALAGGEKGEFIDLYPTAGMQKMVESNDISYAVKRLTGLQVETGACSGILDRLGISVADSGTTYRVPSWRHDITIEEDLVEEVARHFGYENIASELPPAFGAGEYQPGENRKKRIRRALIALGYDEGISYSFIDEASDGQFTPIPDLVQQRSEPYVTLRHSVIEGAVRMRPTAIPGLLAAVRHNLNHQRRDLKLFEIGKVFAASDENGLPVEREILCSVATGGERLADHGNAGREMDFYDAKGAIESAMNAAGSPGVFAATDAVHLRPGQSASISVGSKLIGTIGRLDDAVASNYKFRTPVFVAELDLTTLLDDQPAAAVYRPLARFPSVTRDVTFVVTREMTFASVREAASIDRTPICAGLEFVEVFEGKGLGTDERALTIRLEYRSDERTLSESEVEEAHAQILGRIDESLGLKPRSQSLT